MRSTYYFGIQVWGSTFETLTIISITEISINVSYSPEKNIYMTNFL